MAELNSLLPTMANVAPVNYAQSAMQGMQLGQMANKAQMQNAALQRQAAMRQAITTGSDGN